MKSRFKYFLNLSFWSLIASSFVLSSASPGFAETKPKYGPEAIVLSKSHDYMRRSAAPDYWAISPYYVPQQDERACSLAVVTMLLNAAKKDQKFTSDDELVTQKNLLAKVKNEVWHKGLGEGGHGVSLDELKTIVEESFGAHGFKDVKVEAVHTNDTSKATKDKLHKVLVENEKSDHDFVLINFIQGVYTGDADAGHYAPIAAYDAKNKRALVMDPDRQWYEPYWVSEETLLKGMVTQDKTAQKNRGYLWIKL